MNQTIEIDVGSEIGTLRAVIIHTPGPEVENMTPLNAERALYSDILNLSVVRREYSQFRAILQRFSRTYEIKDLLSTVLHDPDVRNRLIEQIGRNENALSLASQLATLPADKLSLQLIEGVPLRKDNLTRFLSNERYLLQPLHNFFFTRDAAATLNKEAIIARPASKVREREALIMETIFRHHPELRASIIKMPVSSPDGAHVTFEGGDLLIAREDVLVIGTGARTTACGIDCMIEEMKARPGRKHILVQELPTEPESFIHLDMVFTFLDRDTCLSYEPVILNRHDFKTVRFTIDNGTVTSIGEESDLVSALNRLGIAVNPIACGGKTDPWTQEREQWHSGTNFFALGPGQVIGYGRNLHTLEALNQAGFEIISAADVIDGKVDPESSEKFVITIEGAELSRGGGGCRCMTLPIVRAPVNW